MAFACGSDVQLGKEQVAIAIQPGLLGSHIGAAFWTTDGRPAVVHLAFHKILAVVSLPTEPNRWLVCPVPIPELRASQLVANFRALLAMHPYVPGRPHVLDYGISLFAGRGAIRPDGAYSPPPGFDGFTCATFVAEMFRMGNVGLVNLTTWQANDRNRIWGRAIVCMLNAWPAATAEHIAKVESSNSGFRLLPEELAAAGENYAGRPLVQAAVAERAKSIYAEVKDRCQALPRHEGPMAPCIDNYLAEVNVFDSAAAAPAQ
jgi:hypothetical protein